MRGFCRFPDGLILPALPFNNTLKRNIPAKDIQGAAGLGNIIGGVVFVGFAYWFAYLKGVKSEP